MWGNGPQRWWWFNALATSAAMIACAALVGSPNLGAWIVGSLVGGAIVLGLSYLRYRGWCEDAVRRTSP
jgi:hypothetical protein